MPSSVFATAYCGSIEYFSHLIKSEDVIIDQYEWFVKQSLRNRCIISGPNSTLKLIVPFSHFGSNKFAVKDAVINYNEAWHKHHLKSLNTAYNSSPFYEYYKDELSLILLSKPKFLIDLNNHLTSFILKNLNADTQIQYTDSFIENTENDLRILSDGKENNYAFETFAPKTYHQVNSQKFGFISNLSMLDLLFNQGPESVKYL